MPIIAQYIQGENNDLEHFTTLGELSIVFNNVSESKVFIANTLFPFLGITKGYINNAHKFCVSSRTIYGNQKVCISWDLIDSDFIYEEFLKLLVDSIPEINLHTMRVYHNDVVKTSITSLQNWSTSCFIQNFNRDNLDDIVILNIFTQYITIAQTLPLTVSDFYFRNRLVLDKMLINSLSSITQGIIPNAIYENLKSKIASEYNIIMNNNIVELSSIINSLCASWATTGKKNLPPDVTEEVDRLYSCKGVECLIDIYDTIFCTSLLHTFHSGFIPYCINELLPSISKI